MSIWSKLAGRPKGESDKPLQGAKAAPQSGAGEPSKMGQVPRLADEGVHATEMRGPKIDGRRLPKTGRTYQMNIRANEAIVKAFDRDADALGMTRGAFFEKCYHAFKAQQGDEKDAFLLKAMISLEHLARMESKVGNRLVTPEQLLANLIAQRMRQLGLPIERK